MLDQTHLDTLCINTIRTLAMDAVQKANSGHPGPPMGMAPTAYAIWTRFLKHNPTNPAWPDRDCYLGGIPYRCSHLQRLWDSLHRYFLLQGLRHREDKRDDRKKFQDNQFINHAPRAEDRS